jgi:hypothetical protein
MHSEPVDRRGSGRPSNGDTARCPRCGAGAIEFSERYRIVYAGQRKAVPAWVCDVKACGYFELARRRDRALMVRRLGASKTDLAPSAVEPQAPRQTRSRPVRRKNPR